MDRKTWFKKIKKASAPYIFLLVYATVVYSVLNGEPSPINTLASEAIPRTLFAGFFLMLFNLPRIKGEDNLLTVLMGILICSCVIIFTLWFGNYSLLMNLVISLFYVILGTYSSLLASK